jgi:hypothetical protein
MKKPKSYAREVLYRDDTGLIEVVLLTNKIAGGCSHKVYLKRAGLQTGPNIFLGHVNELCATEAIKKVSCELKELAKKLMLNCYQEMHLKK